MVNPSASSPRRLLELEQDSSPFTLPVTVISVCAIWARNGFTRLMAALAARPAILPLFGRLLGAGGEARFDVRLRGFAVEVLAGFLVVAAGDAAMRPQLMAMVADPAVRRSLRAVASLHWPWAQDAAVCVWTYALRAAAADATDAAAAQWFPVAHVPKLAFDHAEILATALARLKGKVRYQPIGFELLPPKFTLSQLQHLYEAVLATELDKRNFRKKVLSFGLLRPLKETQMTGRHRPAQLFRFDTDKYERLKKRGFNFEV